MINNVFSIFLFYSTSYYNLAFLLSSMFSDYQLFGSARRSLSNNKYKLTYSNPEKNTPKSLTLPKILKKIILLKFFNHFQTIKEQSTNNKNKQENLLKISKIMRKIALRNAFAQITSRNNRRIKVFCGLQVLAFGFRRMRN